MTLTLSSHFIWELQDNRVVKNLQFFTLNRGVMLKFLYIERGLFQSYNSPFFATPSPESFLTEMQCLFCPTPLGLPECSVIKDDVFSMKKFINLTLLCCRKILN